MGVNEWALVLGPALGAGITVLGVHLTNRANAKAQERLIEAQSGQHRLTLESEVRGEHIRSVLNMRMDLYSELLSVVDEGKRFLDWVAASGSGLNVPEPDAHDAYERVLGPLRRLRYKVEVVCPGEVRAATERYQEAVAALTDEPISEETKSAVVRTGESLRDCVVQHALRDRTSAVTPQGLGGM